MPLQDSQCKNAVTPDKGVTKLFDGGGLFLQIDNKGRKYWRLQYYRPNDKKKDILAIGIYPSMSLKTARLKRDEAKLLIAAGIDPKQRQKQQDDAAKENTTNTFESVARQWHDNRKDDGNRWSVDHAQRVIRSLELHVFPVLGGNTVTDVMPLDVLNTVKAVEARGTLDTAHRVLDVIRQVFAYAVKLRLCVFNPASDLSSELKKKIKKNYPHITDELKLGELLQAIEQWNGTPTVRALLRISPYVFTRPSEVRLMKWSELDLDAGVWTKQPDDMKNGLAHVVPLCTQAISIIQDLQPFSGRFEYVFWNVAHKQPLSEGATRKALERLGYKGQFSPHGWRHTASTLLHEQGFNTMWIEAQLAHKDSNEIRDTYNHAKYLNDRRTMMQAWADYLDGLKYVY